ncbi:MAG: efflux RND transporter permease subunit, partial [Candidatus Eisenbacteria bacterium]|nr:efflux RND transporter permease subunit [Candidatus Eisenbacteria bacterium]
HVAVKELNAGVLEPAGLELIVAYDTSIYIRDALGLVQNNLAVGGLLAVLVLLLFVRAVAPTIIISVAIPVSAVGTFLAMFLLGRNINVVSLAGLSFAIGMLVDNSIVVLENIFRHAQEGEDEVTASSRGTTEVWGAVLASTLTTVAVFLPLLFMQAEIAQLLRDIALAICCAVILSFGVSVLVIPCLAA